MSDLYVCVHKHARLAGSRGMLPQESFLKFDALRLLLRPFWDRSRAVVATWFTEYFIQFFGCPCMHLLSQLTSNSTTEGWQNSRWGDITRRTTLERLN